MGLKGFVEGGIASVVAGCSTHPLDLIKVRMQLQGETTQSTLAFHPTSAQPPTPKLGPIAVGIKLVQQEGFFALYSGVSATILRQLLYSTTRMGLYDMFKKNWSDPNSGTMPLSKNWSLGWEPRRRGNGPHASRRQAPAGPTTAPQRYKSVAKLLFFGEERKWCEERGSDERPCTSTNGWLYVKMVWVVNDDGGRVTRGILER